MGVNEKKAASLMPREAVGGVTISTFEHRANRIVARKFFQPDCA
jgi:hypothetical protein